MVTFRFYVVSTVAFFLALAVGVVLGSVLDGRIADSLRDRLDGVEQSLDETVDSIDAKNQEIELQQRYIEDSAAYAVEGTMSDTSTLVVAETGIDGADLEGFVRRLRQAGSRVEGVVWMDRRMDLSDEADRTLVAELLEAPPGSTAEELRTAIWETLLRSAAPEASRTDPAVTTSTTIADTVATSTVVEAPDGGTAEVPLLFPHPLLSGLADAGLMRLQTIDGGSEVPASEFLVAGVTGPRSTIGEPGTFVAELAAVSSERRLPTLLGEVHPPSGDPAEQREERGALLVLPEGADPADDASLSTVDDLGLVGGRVAGVLALSELREGRSGRYGLGPGVDAVLPPWQGP